MAFYCNGKKDVCDCDFLCADCQHFDNTGGKKWQTNADRIRAMSDEELAWELMTWRIEAAAKYHGVSSDYPKTKGMILEWLKQPAEVNDHDRC